MGQTLRPFGLDPFLILLFYSLIFHFSPTNHLEFLKTLFIQFIKLYPTIIKDFIYFFLDNLGAYHTKGTCLHIYFSLVFLYQLFDFRYL